MRGRTLQGVIFVLMMGWLSGCASSSGITTRTYVVDKERLDQKMEGNGGYLLGGPPPDAKRPETKKTRKIYVLEFSKEEDAPVEEVLIPPPPRPAPVRTTPPPSPPQARPEPATYQAITIPNFDDEAPVRTPVSAREAAPSAAVTQNYLQYTIQKEDTLQKISKKFYDTYRKWQQIYDANKDVIKDPNQIKPGVTIRIPVE